MVGGKTDLLRDQSVTQALSPSFTCNRLGAHAEILGDLIFGPQFRERFDGAHALIPRSECYTSV